MEIQCRSSSLKIAWSTWEGESFTQLRVCPGGTGITGRPLQQQRQVPFPSPSLQHITHCCLWEPESISIHYLNVLTLNPAPDLLASVLVYIPYTRRAAQTWQYHISNPHVLQGLSLSGSSTSEPCRSPRLTLLKSCALSTQPWSQWLQMQVSFWKQTRARLVKNAPYRGWEPNTSYNRQRQCIHRQMDWKEKNGQDTTTGHMQDT